MFKVNQSLLSFFHFYFYFFKLIKVLELRSYIHIEALLFFKREFNIIFTRYSNPLKVAKSIKVFYLVIKILFLFFSIYYYCLKLIKVFFLSFTFFYFFKLIKVLELRNYIHIEALLFFKREFNVIMTRYFNPLKMQMTKYIYFWLNVKKILIARISPILILIIDNWYPWKKKNQKTQIFGDVIGKAWDGVNILDSHLYRRPSQSKSSIFVIKIPFFFFNLLLLFKVNQSLLSFFHFFILFYFIFKSIKVLEITKLHWYWSFIIIQTWVVRHLDQIF